MFQENTQELLNVTAETASGEGLLKSTGSKGPNKSAAVDKFTGTTSCRFTLNTTAFTGTSMAVDIVTEINGVDVIIASFTDVAAIVQETILVEMCPVNVKVVYTATAVTDWDCTVHSIRF